MYIPREGLTRLILRSNDVERPTARKDCAAREAVARGLAEYMRQLAFSGAGGRDIAFKQVVPIYSDPWTPVELPAANVHGGIGDAELDAKGSGVSPIQAEPLDDASPDLLTDRDRLGDRAPPQHKVALFSPSTFECALTVEVWAADEAQRRMIDHMLEDDFNPTPDWLQGGFRLELPHYGGSRADYHFASSSVSSDGKEALQGKYIARYVLQASLDLRVPRSKPKIIPIVNKVVTNGVLG